MSLLNQIYVVHYSKFIDRYDYLSNRLKDLNLSHITKWVTELKDPSFLENISPQIPLKIKEVSFSHEICLKDIILNKHDYALILEDDVLLELINDYDVNTFLNQCVTEMKNKKIDLSWPGIIPDPNHPVRFEPTDILYYQEGNSSRCCHGYIITPTGARFILNYFHYDLPVDHMYNEAIFNSGLKSYYAKFGFNQGTITGEYASGLRHLGV